jgi:undecaprenyl-diphosphatase
VLVAVTGGDLAVDTSVRAAAAAHEGAHWLGAANVVTDVLSPPVDVGVLVLVALLTGVRRASVRPVLVAGVAIVALSAVVLGLKYGLGRPSPRPITHPDGGSYPSGHTAATLVCYGTAARLLVTRRRSAWLLVAAATAAVAAALVYARYHWLTDVVGSVLVGLPMLAAVGRLARGGGPETAELERPPATWTATERAGHRQP